VGAAGVAAPVSAGSTFVSGFRALWSAGSQAVSLAGRAVLDGSIRAYLFGGTAGSLAANQAGRLASMGRQLGRLALDVNLQLHVRAVNLLQAAAGTGTGAANVVGVGEGIAGIGSFGAGMYVGYQTDLGEAQALNLPPGQGLLSDLGAAFDAGQDVGTLLGQTQQKLMESWEQFAKDWYSGS